MALEVIVSAITELAQCMIVGNNICNCVYLCSSKTLFAKTGGVHDLAGRPLFADVALDGL